MAGAQLSALFEEQKKAHNRKVEYNVSRPDAFVLSGLQGLKRFYVRVQLKDNEARGLTILHDQAMDGIMQPVVVAMSSAFAPFASTAAAVKRRQVDYASGVIVSAAGHILTTLRTSESCSVIVVPRHGNAERIAEDAGSGLALLRINGAAAKPLPLSTEPPQGADLSMIGVADPQAQAGGHAVSSAPAKLHGVEGARVLLDAAPPPGFSGAAALDAQGRFVGMVDVDAQPSLVPAATIRKFLDAAHLTGASGRSSAENAKTSVVRVICVRI
jgi:S1-C subfamily serine protease